MGINILVGGIIGHVQCFQALFSKIMSIIFSNNFIILPCRLVWTTPPHDHSVDRVVGIGFQPGLDPSKVGMRAC